MCSKKTLFFQARAIWKGPCGNFCKLYPRKIGIGKVQKKESSRLAFSPRFFFAASEQFGRFAPFANGEWAGIRTRKISHCIVFHFIGLQLN